MIVTYRTVPYRIVSASMNSVCVCGGTSEATTYLLYFRSVIQASDSCVHVGHRFGGCCCYTSHHLFHTISIDTEHQLVFCRTATVKYYSVHVLSNTHSLAEAETGALLCVSFLCRGEWRQQTRWWWCWWWFTLFSVLCSQLSLCMAAAAAGRSDGWLYTSPIYVLSFLYGPPLRSL